jgi:hypothetical protein
MEFAFCAVRIEFWYIELRAYSGCRSGIIEVIVLLGFKRGRLVVTDVSRQPISPIFKSQELQEEACMTLEDGTDELSRNVAKYRSTHRHITKGEYFMYSYLDERRLRCSTLLQ